MSLVRSLLNRAEGNGILLDYDFALGRLKCFREDSYIGYKSILENNGGADVPIFACEFSTCQGHEELVAIANEDGKIALQDTSDDNKSDSKMHVFQAHTNAVFDVAWMPRELMLVTASGDHAARLWDVSNSDFKQITNFPSGGREEGHRKSIKTVVFRPEDKSVFATGGRDGNIFLWDIRANHKSKADISIVNAHQTSATPVSKRRKGTIKTHGITGLIFQDDFTLISCSDGDGLIKVWDIRNKRYTGNKSPVAEHVMNYTGGTSRNGFSSLVMDPAGITLYANCMDNKIYAYNISSYNSKPYASFSGHLNTSFYIKSCISPDGRYLLSGSADENAYIWNTQRPGRPLIQLTGHTSEEVTSVEWCKVGFTKIVTCSDDSCHKIWKIANGCIELKSDSNEVMITGSASILNEEMDVRKLETTPKVTSRFAQQDSTPGSDASTPGMSSSDTLTGSETRGSKRTNLQMLSGCSKSEKKPGAILSPIQENCESSAKRVCLEIRGARRLFSPSTEGSPRLRSNQGYETDESDNYPSTSTGRGRIETPFSPTLNLPNFVIDGTAPHLSEISPQKSKENVDWLTRICKEKREQVKARRNLEEANASPNASQSATTPARRSARKTSEAQSISSPRGAQSSTMSTTPVRRSSSRSASTERRTTPKILKFLKATGNKESNEKQCSKSTTTQQPAATKSQS